MSKPSLERELGERWKSEGFLSKLLNAQGLVVSWRGKKSGSTSYRGAGFDEPFPSRRLHASSDFTKRWVYSWKKNLASETCLRIKEPLKIRGWIDFLVFFLLPSTSVCAVQIPFCTNNIFRVLSGLAWHGRILQDPFTLMKAYALRTTFWLDFILMRRQYFLIVNNI